MDMKIDSQKPILPYWQKIPSKIDLFLKLFFEQQSFRPVLLESIYKQFKNDPNRKNCPRENIVGMGKKCWS